MPMASWRMERGGGSPKQRCHHDPKENVVDSGFKNGFCL